MDDLRTGLFALTWIILRGPTETGSLGAYGVVARADYDIGSILTWIARTAGDLSLLVLVAPLIAALILATQCFRGRERDLTVQALIAAGLSYAIVTVVLVGSFSSSHVGRLAERNIVSAVPVLFILFAVWLDRGAPRPQPATFVAGLLVAIPTVLLPVRDLVSSAAVPDAFMTVPLYLAFNTGASWELELAWSLAAATIVVLVVLLPRQQLTALAISLLAALVFTSVLTQQEVDNRVSADRSMFFSDGPRSWIDRASHEPVAYLYDGDPLWNGAWHQLYWNERVRTVISLSRHAQLPVPAAQAVTFNRDGRLVYDDGRPVRERLIVAPATITLQGRRIAKLRQGSHQPGLALWRADDVWPRLATRVEGAAGDGSFSERLTVTAFGCQRGVFEVDFDRSSVSTSVTFAVTGFQPATALIPAGRPWHGSIRSPSVSDRGTCAFNLEATAGSVRATRIEFVRRAPPRGESVIVAATTDTRAGYCLGGMFINLWYGQPGWDTRYRGAVPAKYIEGMGITCGEPPQGYDQRGLADRAQGVPAGIYAYYAP